MDNHSWLMIKSFYEFAIVVQVLYINLAVFPSFLFLVSMRVRVLLMQFMKAAETTF